MYTEKIRIYPNPDQCELIDKIIQDSCTLYNLLLEATNVLYQLHKIPIDRYRLDKYAILHCEKYGISIPSRVRKGLVKRLYTSYTRFFKKLARHPIHKGLKKFRSICTYEVNIRSGTHILYNSENPRNSTIQFTMIGKIKANFTRKLNGTPKVVIIKKMRAGEYYAFIQMKGDSTPSKKFNPNFQRKPVVAIDLGINKFLTDQDGNYVSQPRFVEFNEKVIRKEQRKLSRMVKNSNNFKKQCKRLAKLYERVSNIRRDFHFKLAYFLVTNYEKIICEDLKISEIINKKTKSRADKKFKRLLLGCALAQFLDILEYISQKYNCQLIKVDPKHTSQLCSNCGAMVYKKPGKHHNCPHCGLVADRDINAARNIYERGMGQKYFAGTACNGTPVPLQLVNRIIVSGT